MKDSTPGPNGIPSICLKKLAFQLVRPLTIIFQQSLFNDKVLSDWKVAKIIPLHKGKGNKQNPNSYHPISRTSVVYETLEYITCEQISLFAESSSLFTDIKQGFRKNCSTVTNLLACDAQIATWLKNGKDNDLFLLDFQRAFDKVDHTILLKKLPNFEITENCWIGVPTSYMTENSMNSSKMLSWISYQ